MSDTAPPITGAAAATTQADWKAAIPEDMRADPTLATVPDITTLAKNYVATKSLVGKKAYDLPQNDWKPEQWSAWNKTIGVPDSPDKYSPVDKTILEKAGLPTEVMSAAIAKFHESGLTDRQAKGLLDWYLGDTIKGKEMQDASTANARTQGETTLRGEFKDKYDAKMGLVKAFFSQDTPPSVLEKIHNAGLSNDPEFVKWAVKRGEQLMESSARGGGTNPMGDGASKEQALMEIEQMKNDKATTDKYFNGDKDVVARWRRLHEIAYKEMPK